MKINHIALAISLLAALAAAGCTPAEKETVIPTLTLTAAQSAFFNGTAYLTLNLSAAQPTDVVVTLSAQSNLTADRLGFPNPVTIPAGSQSAPVLVTLNDKGLEPGEYTVVISIQGAAGAKVGGSGSVTLTHSARKAIAEVNLSGPERFIDGKATLTLTPDVAPTQDITVTLEVLKFGASEGKELIPPGAITCPETVVLPADKAAPTTFTVRVDMSRVKPVESEAIVAIDGISGPGSIGAADEVRIGAKGELTPRQRTDWSISYAGDQAYEKDPTLFQSIMSIQGVYADDGGGYYIRYGDAGFVSRDYGNMDTFLERKEAQIAQAMTDGKPYSIRKDNGNLPFSRFTVGSYEFYILGCDAKGHLTGDYAKTVFTRSPSEEMRQIYPEWLGEWEVNGQHWIVSFKEDACSYSITGICGIDQPFTAYLGWDGELEIRGETYADVTEEEWYVLDGIYTTDKTYYSSYTGPVAKAFLNEDYKTAQWTGCTCPGPDVRFERLDLYANNASVHWSIALTLPEFMCHWHQGQVPEEYPWGRYAPYEYFLGNWIFDGETISILTKEYNKSYSVYQTVDEELMEIVVDYSPETGMGSIADQVLMEYPYGDNNKAAYALCGGWYDSQKSENFPYFPYVTTTPGNIIARLAATSDGTVHWSSMDIGDYWLYCMGVWMFVWTNDHSSIVGHIGWLGDPIHLVGDTVVMRRKEL